jgi:4-diphosphocytidyl-2-C-methyl-D-erythritol kinase
VSRVVRLARAKLNLTMEVLGRRPDGYHEIRSIMQTIDLADVLEAEKAPELRLYCDQPHLSAEDNLVFRAARLLQERSSPGRGAILSLHKETPEAAGLGGGSSDAAAALLALNDLWELGLTPEELVPLAAGLGSDVPFFVYGGTALASGRGEVLRRLPTLAGLWLVLAKPDLSISNKTATLYRGLTPGDFTDGRRSEEAARHIERGEGLAPAAICNAFERQAFALPAVQRCLETLALAGARNIHLSGSGPALFALCSDEAEARAVSEHVGAAGYWSRPAVTV